MEGNEGRYIGGGEREWREVNEIFQQRIVWLHLYPAELPRYLVWYKVFSQILRASNGHLGF